MSAPDETPVSVRSWGRREGYPTTGGAQFGELITEVRAMLDRLAVAAMDEGDAAHLTEQVRALSATLAAHRAPPEERVFGRRMDLPGRGQTMSPVFQVHDEDAESMRAIVAFGQYFHGGGGMAHGGAICVVFDELLGRLSHLAGGKPSRTAYLHVDFRSVTPLDTDLRLSAKVERIEGRKLFLRATLRDGERLCAEAQGLFVQLLAHHV